MLKYTIWLFISDTNHQHHIKFTWFLNSVQCTVSQIKHSANHICYSSSTSERWGTNSAGFHKLFLTSFEKIKQYNVNQMNRRVKKICYNDRRLSFYCCHPSMLLQWHTKYDRWGVQRNKLSLLKRRAPLEFRGYIHNKFYMPIKNFRW
jgi:hypothetical protein